MTAEAWHGLDPERLARRLGANPATGLGSEEARARLERDGPNRLRPARRVSFLEVFLEEVREPMILLLLVTGTLYAIWGDLEDAITIFVVIAVLVGVEVGNEARAHRAIEALRGLSEPSATVHRDGEPVEVPAEQVVAGDLVSLAAGRRVPADIRILDAHGLAADESALTGESLPVDKEPIPSLPELTPLAERRNMAFAGTTVVRGRGLGVAVATGPRTELGAVVDLAREVRPPRTPLQVAMRELTRWLVLVALGFSLLVPVLGVALAGQPWREMLLVGLSLAFATIPEELPIIVTMVLALGAFRLSRHRAIVKRLQAVETLGAVTLIATDKTGTLTANRLEVERFDPPDFAPRLLEIAVLASEAIDAPGAPAVDPLEAALVRAARESDVNPDLIRHEQPAVREAPFDTDRKLMSVLRRRGVGLRLAVKGAPEHVLAASTHRWTARGRRPMTDGDRADALAAAAEMAGDGLRVLALAERSLDGPADEEAAERDLTYAGLVGLADPPRAEAPAAIEAARGAGIRPIMVTGDHPRTAAAIASRVELDGRVMTGTELDGCPDEELGAALREVEVFARTTPAHKLRIVRAAHALGERVAVTGDGINDAPALAAADIGIAMGRHGTDVAREAADLVLADDDFATIVRATAEGRLLFENLRKGVRYYLACKVALISAMLLPALLAIPVPFAPIQIILMELFMDLAASSAFVAERPEADLMRRPPRDPRRPFMDRPMVTSVLVAGAGLFAAVSIAYLVTWSDAAARPRAGTVAFVTWLVGHFLLALNLRAERQPLLGLGLGTNRVMLAWGLAVAAFVLVAVLVPGARSALRTEALSPGQWALALGAAVIGTTWMEPMRWLRSGRSWRA